MSERAGDLVFGRTDAVACALFFGLCFRSFRRGGVGERPVHLCLWTIPAGVENVVVVCLCVPTEIECDISRFEILGLPGRSKAAAMAVEAENGILLR